MIVEKGHWVGGGKAPLVPSVPTALILLTVFQSGFLVLGVESYQEFRRSNIENSRNI